ncbi:MAG: UDP-N-acetylmuramoyl-tripeptide--D-alanyl-D-alanine ligase, partial [Verrucomicrobiota bacterium]
GDRAVPIHDAASGLADRQHFDDHGAAARSLQLIMTPEDLALVKGSRAAAMEKVIQFFSSL